jgi:hypothetical protein
VLDGLETTCKRRTYGYGFVRHRRGITEVHNGHIPGGADVKRRGVPNREGLSTNKIDGRNINRDGVAGVKSARAFVGGACGDSHLGPLRSQLEMRADTADAKMAVTRVKISLPPYESHVSGTVAANKVLARPIADDSCLTLEV